MSRKLFDFECSTCHSIFEELVDDDIKVIPCTSCHGESHRQISAPRIDWLHMGVDPGFPGAYAKWGKAKTIHHKTDKGTMRGGKAPNLLMY